MRRSFLILVAALALPLLAGGRAGAQGHGMMGEGEHHHPYGGYCQGPGWGWYGERAPVRTEREARRRLEAYFAGKNLAIGKITTEGQYFLADIRNEKDEVVDRVMIDKRSGRIRSVY